MSTIDVNNLLSQMRQMSSQVRPPAAGMSADIGKVGGLGLGAGVVKPGQSDFGALLKQTIAAVGENQMQAGRMSAAFERGDPGADLGRTMVAVQKAELSLNATVQVRNKLVDAYKDIMNMPV